MTGRLSNVNAISRQFTAACKRIAIEKLLLSHHRLTDPVQRHGSARKFLRSSLAHPLPVKVT
jgi:hypothetical protein